jgi:chromatin modification-related protein EAF6
MSQIGPPADAKQAQAAALHELEAAMKRKRAIDTSLVSTVGDLEGPLLHSLICG